MIIEVLKDGFKTVKEHKWSILGMSLPLFFVLLFANGFSSGSSIMAASSNLAYNPGAVTNAFQNSFMMMMAVSIVVTLFKVSLQMGLFKSDQEGKYVFKNAFVAFKGLTWVSVIVISLLVGLLFLIFLFIFSGITFGFVIAGFTEENAFFFAIAALVAILGVAIYAYIALGLYFVFLTYYADTKDLDNGIFKAFSETWKLMKGHRYQLLGLVVLQALMLIVTATLFFLLVWLISLLMSLITIAGILVAISIILGLLIFVAGLVMFLFFQFWFTMDGIKFFERLK